MRPINVNLRQEHTAVINKLIEYIDEHIEKPLELKDLSEKALVSPYHLHRVFKSITGETIHAYVNRIRLEKAASKLKHSETIDVSETSRQCGFSSVSIFSRSFRNHFGVSATEYRKMYSINSKSRKINSKNNQLQSTWLAYNKGGANDLELDITIKRMRPCYIAYIRTNGRVLEKTFEENRNHLETMGAIFDWARQHSLWNPPLTSLLSIEYQDPSVSGNKYMRVDCGLTLLKPIDSTGEVGCRLFAGGQYAVLRIFDTTMHARERVKQFWEDWLPNSGFYYTSQPVIILHQNNPSWEPSYRYFVDYAVPISPKQYPGKNLSHYREEMRTPPPRPDLPRLTQLFEEERP
ncbi:AraC family transcriptional regulator [Paenibacillus sp. NEAU-GSW1]|uniref:AraC family transcriptional regulator n=1 Tax=Paenibacillus sp. NEAU-GSW1 TaxID=2682486 RepID=UPI0012E2DA94|nr:AraC family transcriptional regulator [Paenibacillus sp. NEAU-GSW1]MUT65375.1 helix-turn-helix domain-containing protein [Paenibacillus sp. NEAU-GSW1]